MLAKGGPPALYDMYVKQIKINQRANGANSTATSPTNPFNQDSASALMLNVDYTQV